jgi:hypothetical protein
MVRHPELKEQADSLPRGSAERKTLEKRISHLEQYRLPKQEGGRSSDEGAVPEEFTIKRRAA